VVNTPGTNAAAVAEHSLALILACSRRVVSADQATRRGNWAYREAAHPVELAGRCLGLVGYGHVARHLARMASSLGFGVLVLSGHATATELARDGVRQARDLDELLAEADIVSLHGLPDHAPRLTAAHFQRMRPEAIVINTARGSLIDEAALADALHRGAISAAALDVFASEPLPADSPLLDCPNLVVTPHMAGTGVEASARTALAVARKVLSELGLPDPDRTDSACQGTQA
jgi:D-3-phosphoglycerate dehydrogenase